MAPSSGWVGRCQASFLLYPIFMSGGGWSMRMWNQMLLIWTLSKANGVDKKAVQLTASTAYTSCLISSRRKNKNRSISNVLLCFPWCPLSVFFPFLQSDVIETTHPTFSLLKWKLQRIKNVQIRRDKFNPSPCQGFSGWVLPTHDSHIVCFILVCFIHFAQSPRTLSYEFLKVWHL